MSGARQPAAVAAPVERGEDLVLEPAQEDALVERVGDVVFGVAGEEGPRDRGGAERAIGQEEEVAENLAAAARDRESAAGVAGRAGGGIGAVFEQFAIIGQAVIEPGNCARPAREIRPASPRARPPCRPIRSRSPRPRRSCGRCGRRRCPARHRRRGAAGSRPRAARRGRGGKSSPPDKRAADIVAELADMIGDDRHQPVAMGGDARVERHRLDRRQRPGGDMGADAVRRSSASTRPGPSVFNSAKIVSLPIGTTLNANS